MAGPKFEMSTPLKLLTTAAILAGSFCLFCVIGTVISFLFIPSLAAYMLFILIYAGVCCPPIFIILGIICVALYTYEKREWDNEVRKGLIE